MGEKLERIEEVERKLRKFRRKGYKLMAELKEIEAFKDSLSVKYAKEAFDRTIDWSNRVTSTARKYVDVDMH